jgi:hypothetical protein
MKQILQEFLTDVSVRDADRLTLVSSQADSDFLPWLPAE